MNATEKIKANVASYNRINNIINVITSDFVIKFNTNNGLWFIPDTKIKGKGSDSMLDFYRKNKSNKIISLKDK